MACDVSPVAMFEFGDIREKQQCQYKMVSPTGNQSGNPSSTIPNPTSQQSEGALMLVAGCCNKNDTGTR